MNYNFNNRNKNIRNAKSQQTSNERNKLSSMCKLNHKNPISRKIYVKQNATVDRSGIHTTSDENNI